MAIEARYEEILSAARDVIGRRGFAYASIREIARAAGLSLAGLYHYVGGKDELLFLVLDRALHTLIGMADAALAGEPGGPQARLRALIAKKTIRAPFRARVGLADVHPGQYLNEGVTLTTLQGVADEVHVDFSLSQSVAAGIQPGSSVEVRTSRGQTLTAEVVAVDSRVDPTTRSAIKKLSKRPR